MNSNHHFSFDDIERALSQVSTTLVGEDRLERPSWSAAIRSSFTALAYSRDFWASCHPSECDGTTTEWLWDFVAYEALNGDAANVGKLALVLEAEYDSTPHKILEDLHKIFVARAALRCFVFWAGDVEHREAVFSLIDSTLASSPNVESGDVTS